MNNLASCLLSARFNMKMDVLKQEKYQTESGEISRHWVAKDEEVPCIARGISGGGIRVVGSTERWGDRHEDVEYVKIQTNYNVSKRDRIQNIRTSNGSLAWEDEGVGMVFDVVGSTPVLGPFGELIEYDVLVTKAEIQ